MASLTCKNHTHLRWSCKRLAISNGGYDGARSIFFMGTPTTNPPTLHSDKSGVDCNGTYEVEGKLHIVKECDCPPEDLILSPEDKYLSDHRE